MLTPSQLSDLTNYVLGLPVRHLPSGGLARRDGISPCVLHSWGKANQEQLTEWLEHQLSIHQISPGRRHRPPQCFQHWLNAVSA